MADRSERIGTRGWPVASVALAGAAAIALIPGASERLILDRAAVQAGEWWRVLTGSWVHLSSAHFAADSLAALVASVLLEREGERAVWRVWLAAALASGVGVLLFEPSLGRYAGLSGIAFALVTLLALRGAGAPASRRAGRWATWRIVCLATLVLLSLKLGYELTLGRYVILRMTEGAVAVPLVHVLGAATAMGFWMASRPWRSASVPPRARHGGMH